MSSTPSIRPSPARRMGTMVTILPEMDSTSTGPAQPLMVRFSVLNCLVASYMSNRAISLASIRNSLVEVDSFLRMPSLCRTRG